MSLNSYQQRDEDCLLGKAHRTVLPPSRYIPGSHNKLPSLDLGNNKLPSLVPEILVSSLQEGHWIQLSTGNALKQPGLLRVTTQSDSREELSPVRIVNHRTVFPKALPDGNRSQSLRRVVPPKGKSETSGSAQQDQQDSRPSAYLQTMTKQAYEEELEFLKLKLRYMQNDIEFKQKQLDSAKMLKLKSTTATNKWNQSNNNGLVQGGKFQEVHQVASSHGFPAQQSTFHHRAPATVWAASGVSLPQMKAAASMLYYSGLQGRDAPPSVPSTSNRYVLGSTGSKSLVTGSSKSCLTTGTESNKFCVAAGISQSCESNKLSMLTESLTNESNKPSIAAESKSSSAAYLRSSQLLPETTFNLWNHGSSSTDVRTVYPSCERTLPSRTYTAHVNSMPSQQKTVANYQIANKKTEQATACPTDPSVVLNELNKEMLFSNQASAPGSPASIFDRLGIQRISEVPQIVPASPDKRIVVPSKVAPAVLPAASDMTQTVGHTTSLPAVACEASTAHSLDISGDNMKEMSYSKGVSRVPHAEARSGSDPAWNPHSVKPASIYRFVKPPSNVNVDIAKTSAASIVNSVVLPSSLNFTSSSIIPSKERLTARREPQVSRLSLQSPKSIPPAAEIVNKYKLTRLPPAMVHKAAAQLFPAKRSSPPSVVQQADSKCLTQNTTTQPMFVSTYNLIKTPSHMPIISNSPAACEVYSEASSSSLYGSNMSRNSLPSIPPVTAPARRASQGSRFSLKNPNLKLHTAAKLVSKYKLKRLSPTLTPQTAPLFYNKLLYKQATLAHNHTGNKTPGQYSRSQLKLDRRLTKINPAGLKVGQMKLGDEYSNKLPVLTQKLKIDRRPAVTQSSKNIDASLSSHKFKIDKIRKADSVPIVKADDPFCAGKSVVDRRVSKAGLFKLQVMSKPMAVDRRFKHCWAGPQSVAASKARSGNRLSSKYSWRKSGLPAAQSSRFKWSRPNVQAQNEAWQQLRQKLQLLLMKKHRNSRYKFFKYPTMAAASSACNRRSQVGAYKTSLVTIDGVTYKSSACKLTRTRRLSSRSAVKRTVTPPGCSPDVGGRKVPQGQAMKLISLRGVHFHVDQSGKKLCRTLPAAIPGASAGTKKSTSSNADVNIVNFANRVIHRSIAIATAKYKKNNQKSKVSHCKFFSRFGKCHRGDNCPYVHDPEKVAVCTRFLRGRCDAKDCPFSHKASMNKMPVCLFYLRGSCSRDSCPYLHVRVNPSAPVCKDFRNGFCALGEKCKKIHSHVCPSFAMTGVCSRASTCTMLHRASRKEQEPPAQDKLKKKSSAPCTSSASYPGRSTITPNFKEPLVAQPSFISLGINPAASVAPQVTASTQSVTCLGTTPAPSFISLETTPTPSFISLDTATPPPFISLDTTPTPSFISLDTAPTPSFISLDTAPTPSFISLETVSAPSFISLETKHPQGSTKSDPSGTKPELASKQGRSAEMMSGQDNSATGTLLNIRPSFMTKKMSSQNS